MPITTEQIKAVRVEMKRLNDKMKELENIVPEPESEVPDFFYNFPKQTGAIRRASMDLTRALADLRR